MPPSNRKLAGTLRVPGDKSITHRALIFSVFTRGKSVVSGVSPAEDCASTAACLEALGLDMQPLEAESAANGHRSVAITAPGLAGLSAPAAPLFAGNSGTTMRLLAGLLAGRPFAATIDGDSSLRRRPMFRVIEPLARMGAKFQFAAADGLAPFTVCGADLEGIDYHVPVASAQVQTALLLAGLQARGRTTVSLPGAVRDHTTRMFDQIGIEWSSPAEGAVCVSRLDSDLPPFSISVAADISSAAFFMVAAACLPGSRVTLTDVGVNAGRRLVLDVLAEMGADISLENQRLVSREPVADITVSGSGRLTGTTIGGDRVAAGIDEIPILSLAGALCQGSFVVSDAQELKVKETNRLAAIVGNLRAAGAEVTETEGGFAVEGSRSLPGGCYWAAHGDHRMAMTGLVADLLCDAPVEVDDRSCLAVSYPGFESDLGRLLA